MKHLKSKLELLIKSISFNYANSLKGIKGRI